MPYNGQWLVQDLATGRTAYLPAFTAGGSGVWNVYTDASGFDAITQGGCEPPIFASALFQVPVTPPLAEPEPMPLMDLDPFHAEGAGTSV
jgi:hypothetical protein